MNFANKNTGFQFGGGGGPGEASATSAGGGAARSGRSVAAPREQQLFV